MFRRIMREMLLEEWGYDEAPYTDILNSLKDIQKTLENQQTPIDWSFVRFHLGRLWQLKKHAEFFYDVISYIYSLFNVYRCRDFSVIADAVQLQCFVCENSSASFRKAKIMTDSMIRNISCIETGGLNYVAQLMKMPYKSHTSPYVSMYDLIQMNIITKEGRILRQLLEYGVMYIPLSDHRRTWSYCRKRLFHFLDIEEEPMLLNSRTIQANVRELSDESRQRMLAVFRGVEVILTAKVTQVYERDFGLFFRMAYETIPEPVITSREIVAFLKLFFSDPSADAFIRVVTRYYKKLFPESLEPLAPRTLKHLSRCQVRQNLRQAGTFPSGILDLTIPTVLKNYIHSVVSDYMLEQFKSFYD